MSNYRFFVIFNIFAIYGFDFLI